MCLGPCSIAGTQGAAGGCCGDRAGAARRAQAPCEASVGSCELIPCDWLSWDATGCCILAYVFKNRMPLKALRFLRIQTCQYKGFNFP